ncbi:hypothetical protein CYLTODRAFT_403191 [Cylindrobasidium torrendii FP15055 ss-10]|uniref:General negative regulator of transcription subunit n=1 Tax=Cylindrobasidium torrendii FP15055 ss-10 TaxID=1314674 RepID=A0A0D7B1T9_9AGAR|nr:hypothetical protein CYLTODRAFT_403191 [Cylindrobasidium torrendii FP15055 ss-10]
MAARKLQTEIDRTLKKVAEGVELFESIYDKMQAATNQTQKEKLETDLKTQIKKLQRLRDQIKTWVASNDIKDKSSLVDNRKLIETQMEKFKACEKEMKTKAFSTIGLIQAAKLDPKEQEKEEETQWLSAKVEEMQMQIEQAEAEIEALQGTGKKGRKASAAAGRVDELEHMNERRKWHVSRIELVLRLLQNGTLTTERCMTLHDDVSYFVESNQEEDFDEDEGIYDELNLDEEEEKFGIAAAEEEESDSDNASEPAVELPIPPRTPKKHEKEKEKEEDHPTKPQESPVLKKANTSLQLRKHSIDSKPPPNLSFTAQSMSSVVKSGLPTPRPAAQLPPIRYSTVVNQTAPTSATSQTAPSSAQAVSSSTPTTVPTPSTPSTVPSTAQGVDPLSSPSASHLSVTSPMLSSAASFQPDGSFYSSADSPAVSEAVPSEGPAATSSPQQILATRKDSPPRTVLQSPGATHALAVEPSSHASLPSPLPQQVQQRTVSPPSSSLDPPPGFASSKAPGGETQQSQPARTMPGLSDLVVSFENVKQKAFRMSNHEQVHKILEGGMANRPEPHDTEKPKYYVPRHQFHTASYYPQTPLALLSTQAIFQQLDVETLFYVFYYLPGTYQQYLAAKELKRQSWRFHIKYLTWFQRHSEPQAITEDYEQGVYVYFDWEGSWCQRKKSDFRFEYRYLSEE